MGYFDFLVDEGKRPDIHQVYMYNLDVAWTGKTLGDTIKVKPGTLVHAVTRFPGGYKFRFVDTNLYGTEVYQCSYTWAFIEHTMMNCVRYLCLKFLESIRGFLDRRCKRIRRKLDTLKIEESVKKEERNAFERSGLR